MARTPSPCSSRRSEEAIMRHPISRVLLAASLAAGLTVAPAGALELTRGYVIAAGGARSTGGGFELTGTAGQPVVGVSSAGAFALCHGFWCNDARAVIAVDPPGEMLPAVVEFGQPMPNPSA